MLIDIDILVGMLVLVGILVGMLMLVGMLVLQTAMISGSFKMCQLKVE